MTMVSEPTDDGRRTNGKWSMVVAKIFAVSGNSIPIHYYLLKNYAQILDLEKGFSENIRLKIM